MRCIVEEFPNYTLIRLDGSMSDDYLRDIRAAFETSLGRELALVVDLTEVTFISSSGLGLLFNSNSRLKAKGRKMMIAGPREDIRRLFAVTRIENHVLLFETLQEAVASVF
jgi:anti-sigma B factor antagonist